MNKYEAKRLMCPMMSTSGEEGLRTVYCESDKCAVWESWEWTDSKKELRNENEGICGLISKENPNG